jgi:hypothetical protein
MSTNTKQTSPAIASLAGRTLQSNSASGIERSMAAAALRQSGTSAQTGAAMESRAARALDNPRSSATTRALAGSVVSQANRSR